MPKTVGLIPERRKIVEIGRIYAYVKKEIIREMQKMSLTKYSEIAAIRTRKRIDRILELANKKTYQWAKDAIPAAYGEAKRKADVSLDILGLKPNPLYDTRKHVGSMDDSITKIMDYMIKANGSTKKITNQYLYLMRLAANELIQIQEFEGWEEAAEQWIRDEILEGVETGASRQFIASKIRVYLLDQIDEDGLIEVKGRRYQPRYYAEMVARTEMRRAQSQAVINSCHQYGTDLVEVSDHGTTTPKCLPYEGKVFSLSGHSVDHAYLDAEPPFHPRCLIPQSRILTNKGLIQIKNIKEGDLVYTHKGRFKAVLHVMKRKFKGQLIWINGMGITYNHKIFTKSGLIPAGNLIISDKIYEISSKGIRAAHIPFNSNYIPSKRHQSFIPFHILFNSPVMTTPINFKINVFDCEIKNVFINNFFLNKFNVEFFKNISSKFMHFGLIFQSAFRLALRHLFSNFWINRRIIVNHSNFIFPICFRSKIGYATRYNSSSLFSFYSKMIKNFSNSMSISSIQTKNFSNFFYIFQKFIMLFYNFFKWIFKIRLDSGNFIQKLLFLSTSERASFGIPKFDRFSTNKTIVHNASYKLKRVINYTPKMLPYHGEVFNIEIKDDHSYVAEGFLVKNCQHFLYPTSPEAVATGPFKEYQESPWFKGIR